MENLLMIAVQSGILILALLLIRRIFLGRIDPLLQYGLWGIVALRLLVPVRIESGTSIFNLAAPLTPAHDRIGPIAAFPGGTLSGPPASLLPSAMPASGSSAPTPAEYGMDAQALIPAVLTAIWIAGMAAVLVYTLIGNIRFYRHIDRTGIRRDGYILCRNLPSPCLIGLFRPRIVLNARAEQSETAKKYALLHERTHLSHGDHYWALLRTLCCTVYWFHPLVWIAAAVCRRDQEIACDYSVTKGLDQEKSIEYGEVLIALIRRKKPLPALSTAMANGKRDITQRLRLIADRPRMLTRTAVILLALVLAAAALACTDAVTEEAGEAEEPGMTDAIQPEPSPAHDAPADAGPSFDRTTMDGAAAEFLTRYFDDMASGNTDWGWDPADNSQYDKLIAYTSFYYEQFCYLKQWIDFTSFCRETGAMDRGRFETLTVQSAGAADSIVPGLEEYVLEGYFRTTVMGTLVRMGFTRSDAGEYRVVCVEFPDWTEYNSFQRDCFQYFTSHGVTDPNSNAYIQSLWRERDGLAEKREEWKKGVLDSERFYDDGAAVSLSYYGVTLAANGTRQTQNMRESTVADDRFVRADDENVELLVHRVTRGTLSEETDLTGYAADNTQWTESQLAEAVSFSETTEFDPDAFFVHQGTLVKRLVRQLKCYGDGHVYTVYYAEFAADGGDVVLLFRFLNARKDAGGVWHIYQTETDCQSWMQTLRLTGD